MTIFSRINNLPTRGAFLETMKNVVLTTIPLLSEFMKLKYSHDLAVTSKIYFNIQESCMYNCKYKNKILPSRAISKEISMEGKSIKCLIVQILINVT